MLLQTSLCWSLLGRTHRLRTGDREQTRSDERRLEAVVGGDTRRERGPLVLTSFLGTSGFPAEVLRTDEMERDRSGTAELEGDRSELAAVLAGQLRRGVVERLLETDVPLSLADLAVELARADVEAEGDRWTRAECYWIKLYHNHVAALEDAGLVEYDRDRRTVSLAPGAADWEFDDEAIAAMETPADQRSILE